MTPLPVTVIIPTWNGGELFRRALLALMSQEPAAERVLVIDSSSSDGTDRVAEELGATVLRIAQSEFNHGLTRQMGVELSETEFVAFLSQDAIPEPRYLGALIAPFADAAVGATSGRVLPHVDSSPLAARTVLSGPGAATEPRRVSCRDESFESLTREEQRSLFLLDNVSSMMRRSLLLKHPFPATMMGEDAVFAEQALRAGYDLAFVPDAVVRHAHEYGPVSAFRRYSSDAAWVRSQYGVIVRPSLFSLLRGIAHEVRADCRYLYSHRPRVRLTEWLRSPPLRIAQLVGQWWGGLERSSR